MKKLTTEQQLVFDIAVDFNLKNNCPADLQYICDETKKVYPLAMWTVRRIVKELQVFGYFRKCDEQKSRMMCRPYNLKVVKEIK
jgi:hypothetical protein